MDLDPAARLGPVHVRHAEIIIPEAAFQELVAAGAQRAGLNASGSLGRDEIAVSVNVALLRVRATFGATVDGGRLVLTPRGGLPGWLIGQAAALVNRTAGVTMSRDGRVTIDPIPLAPPGISLARGFTSVIITQEAITTTLG